MIDYMCEHQNRVVYSHLFERNMIDFMNKGVRMYKLF